MSGQVGNQWFKRLRHFWCVLIHFGNLNEIDEEGRLIRYEYLYWGSKLDAMRCKSCGLLFD